MPPPLMVVHKKKLLGLSLCVAPFGKVSYEENKPCNLYSDAPQIAPGIHIGLKYEGWNFNSGNYLFTTDTK